VVDLVVPILAAAIGAVVTYVASRRQHQIEKRKLAIEHARLENEIMRLRNDVKQQERKQLDQDMENRRRLSRELVAGLYRCQRPSWWRVPSRKALQELRSQLLVNGFTDLAAKVDAMMAIVFPDETFTESVKEQFKFYVHPIEMSRRDNEHSRQYDKLLRELEQAIHDLSCDSQGSGARDAD
jgi:hypothetical protein